MSEHKMRESWVVILLLAAMGLCLSWTLQAAELTEGIGILQLVVLGATAVGIILARSTAPDLAVHGASLILAYGWSMFLVATRLPEEMAWFERLQNLNVRIGTWWIQITSGGESYDSLMFLLFASLLFWVFGYVAAMSVFRWRLVWLAIIPNGTVILMNAYYNPRLLPYFASYLLLSLLLIVRFALYQKEIRWRQTKVRYNPELILGFLRDGTLTAFIVIAFAWFVPLSTSDYRDLRAWEYINEPWQEIQFHWNRMFASLTGYGPPRFGFFTDSLDLGGPVSLGTAPVMTVEADEPHYWRALVFDAYTGRGWRNTDVEETEVAAGDQVPLPMPYEERAELVQTASLFRPGEKVIFAANQVASVDRQATVRVSYLPPITEAGQLAPLEGAGPYGEISIMASSQPLRRNEVYRAVSYVSTATPTQLRDAGTAYPEWIMERYLQLPDEMPERVVELTAAITAPYDSVYAKSVAVERYLRDIPYNESIDAPPPGVDVVEWFLFERREGYCDYYSTAMAVMLRAAGIPARVARGYATGEYNEDADIYTVRELDAHAWPEVYFPRYGWVEFEPTASEPLLTRPEDPDAAGPLENTTDQDGPFIPPGMDPIEDDPYLFPDNTPWTPPARLPWWQRTDWLVNLVPVIPVLLGGWAIWYLRKRRQAETTLITTAFDNIMRYARWLQIDLGQHQTPFECAAAIAAYAPEAKKDVYAIAEWYVRQHYSGQEITVYDEMNASDAWRRVRRVLRTYLIVSVLPLKEQTAENLRTALAS